METHGVRRLSHHAKDSKLKFLTFFFWSYRKAFAAYYDTRVFHSLSGAVTRLGGGDRWVSDAIAYLAALGCVIKTSVFTLWLRGDGARRSVLHTVCGIWPSPRKGLSTLLIRSPWLLCCFSFFDSLVHFLSLFAFSFIFFVCVSVCSTRVSCLLIFINCS